MSIEGRGTEVEILPMMLQNRDNGIGPDHIIFHQETENGMAIGVPSITITTSDHTCISFDHEQSLRLRDWIIEAVKYNPEEVWPNKSAAEQETKLEADIKKLTAKYSKRRKEYREWFDSTERLGAHLTDTFVKDLNELLKRHVK